MVTVHREELITEICLDTGFSRDQVRRVWDSLFSNIILDLSKKRRVVLNGFGTFEMKERAPRTGRNPHTGEAVPIPARIIPAFTPGDRLKLTAYLPVRKERVRK